MVIMGMCKMDRYRVSTGKGHIATMGKKEKRKKAVESIAVSPCIFSEILSLSLPRDVPTRPTIPTPKCTPDGRLHSCIKKKKIA